MISMRRSFHARRIKTEGLWSKYGITSQRFNHIFGYDKENEKFVRRAKIKMSGNIYSSRGLYIDDNLYVIGVDGNVIVLDMDNYNELLRFKMK